MADVRALFAVCVALSLTSPTPAAIAAPAQRIKLTVLGSARYLRGRWSRGVRQRAIRDGFRLAIRRCVKLLLPSQVTAARKKKLLAHMESRAAEFVYGYRILNQSMTRFYFQLTLQVIVERSSLQKAVKAWLSSGTPSPQTRANPARKPK